MFVAKGKKNQEKGRNKKLKKMKLRKHDLKCRFVCLHCIDYVASNETGL